MDYLLEVDCTVRPFIFLLSTEVDILYHVMKELGEVESEIGLDEIHFCPI